MVRFNKDENNKRTIVRTNNGPFISSTPTTNTPQRTERNNNSNRNEGYNSDDERRPRSIVKRIDDEGVKVTFSSISSLILSLNYKPY